jgi:crotonobetainyl-CoA:carnitine CoA-transferase CaiB-like acyl-CoA transferase
MTGPLAGIRVLDIGTRISAPFCAGLLGELGAEVIKVEDPRGGDFMRTVGPFASTPGDDGTPENYSLFWAVEGRGRQGITCNLRVPEGQELFRRLAATADIVCENFRPGTLEKWHIAPGDCDPSLVWVRVSVFGQDGPYSERPGLDRMGIAYGGLLEITGEKDRPPVRPGVTVSDYLTGVFGAMSALAGLYGRDAGRPGSDRPGRGTVIDAPLYGSIMRILEWTIAGYDHDGRIRTRSGNRLDTSAPLDNYPTVDGRYVCIVAGADANFRRLCAAMGQPELAEEPRWASLALRAAGSDEINGIVADWTRTRTVEELETACLEAGVPFGVAYSAADIVADPHMTARGDLVTVDDPVLGPIKQQAPFPRLDGQVPVAPSGAPTLGQDNDKVWCELIGLSHAELADLRERGVL